MHQKNIKQKIIILTSFFIISLGYFVQIQDLSQDATKLIFIFLGIIPLWLMVSIEWPSLLLLLLIGFLDNVGFKQMINMSFGNETFTFLLFTFLLTSALSETNFIKRCSYFFINTSFAKKNIFNFLIMFSLSVIFLGSFISPTVLFMFFLPIVYEFYNILKLEKNSRIAEMIMISLAFCVSISSAITPISHVFSSLAISFYNKYTNSNISHFEYIKIALPICILTFLFLMYLLKIVYKKEINEYNKNYINIKLKKVEKINKQEIFILSIFIFTIILWITPSLIESIYPSFSKKLSSYTTTMPPLLATILLSIIKIDNKECLNFKKSLSSSVPWTSLIMAASALALGSVINNEKIGLINFISQISNNTLKNMNVLLIVFIILLWVSLQTNFSSNIVTITVVSNICIPLIISNKYDIDIKTLTIMMGLLSSLAFMTPPSMPHISIAGSSGYAKPSTIFKLGFILITFSLIICILFYKMIKG